jgi:hypothetical protein
VLKLEPVELQEHKEERGHQWHKPGRNIEGEEDELPWPEVDKREGATHQTTVIPRACHSTTRFSTMRSAGVRR